MNTNSEELRMKSEELASVAVNRKCPCSFPISHLPSPISHSPSGFSLVEVMLAVGIVAFAVVGVLTAFPVGIEAARDSRDETTAALIADDVFTRMRSQPFTSVRIPQVPFKTVSLATSPGWNGAGPNYQDLFCYARNGQPANAAGGGTLGQGPQSGSSYKSDEGYFAVRIYVRNNPYQGKTTDGSISAMTDLACVILEVSWPVRQPYDNRKFKRNFDTVIAKVQ